MGVVNDLDSLCPKVPPLSSSIQQLCSNVRGRMVARRASVEQRSHMLNMYDRFLTLFREVCVCVCVCMGGCTLALISYKLTLYMFNCRDLCLCAGEL